MFKFSKKKLIYSGSIVILLLFLLFLSPALRPPLVFVLKTPLRLVSFIQYEFNALIHFHRNAVLNERLSADNQLLRYKINSFNELSLENVRLKQALAFKQKAPFRVVAARVVARSADNWSTSVIIDKGSDQGIREHMPAINHLGVVGRIVESWGSASKVMLITDPGLGVSSLTQRSRQEGLVCGTLGSNLIMKYIPMSADIKKGDIVVTSGLNQSYPKGILIGSVVDIGRDFSGLSSFALIKPAVNLSNIEEVLVIVQ